MDHEKPEGFDLRDRRSDKTKLSIDWAPADALYDAAQALKSQSCKELVVIWWEETGPNKRNIHWRVATSSAAETTHLLYSMLLGNR